MKKSAICSLVLSSLVAGCSDDTSPNDPADTADSGVDTSADVPHSDAVDDAAADAGSDVADTADIEEEIVADFAARGPFVAGHVAMTLRDETRERDVPVTIWYPAADGDTSATTEAAALIADDTNAATYDGLLATAPANCPSREVLGVADAVADAAASWPLVVYSHCHECIGLSGASVASHLASHGFAVAVPDHTTNTLFDGLEGSGAALNVDTLAMRVDDLQAVLDTLLDESSELVPSTIRGRFDASRVGAIGHSFGAVSVSRLAGIDDRVRSVMPMGAPSESPLFAGVALADIAVPIFFVLLTEDNSITEVGNTFIRDNFAVANTPAFKLEVIDAGHWSVSDICGVVDAVMPGCGEDQRQTAPRETFTYLPVADGLAIASEWAVRFFAATLDSNEQAAGELRATDDSRVLLDVRE